MSNLGKTLIIAPHPDDEAIGCGGLISRSIEWGNNVHVLFCATGMCRQIVTGQTEMYIRAMEAQKSSNIGDFSYSWMLTGDKFMKLDSVPQKNLIDPIEDCIAEYKPNVICIPSQHSYDQDHRAIFQAAYTALRPIPQYLKHFCTTILEYEEPYSWSVGEAFKPNFYISMDKKNIKMKIALIQAHDTQLRQEPFSRSVENIERLAHIRGAEVGTYAAEAYKLHRTILT